MAVVNIGTGPNTGTGDPIRTAFQKINDFLANLGPTIKADPNTVASNATGGVSTLVASLTGTVSYSALAGTTAGVTVANNGAITISSAIPQGSTVTIKARAANNTGDAIERNVVITGGAAGPVPAPVFTTQPSISPSSGSAGQTFTANDGIASNAASYTRRWMLDGTQIGTGTTVVPSLSGNLTLQVTATNTTGNVVATSAAVAISSAPVVPAEFTGLSDDMSGTSFLTARSNWTVNDPAFNSFWKIENGYLHLTQRDRAMNTVLFGGVTSDFDITFDYDFTGGAPDPSGNGFVQDNQQIVFWWQDDNNYCYIKFSDATNPYLPHNRIDFYRVSGGTETFITRTGNGIGAGNSGVVKFRLLMVAGQLRIAINRTWVLGDGSFSKFPFDVIDFTSVPNAARTGRFGIRAGSNAYPLYKSVVVRDMDCTVDRVPPFMPRDGLAASGASAVPISGKYGGSAAPQSWVYRLLKFGSPGVVLKDWATLPNVTASNGSWTATAPVPNGGPYVVQAGYIGSDGLLHSDFSRRLLVGAFGMVWGQSNAVYRRLRQDQGNLITRGLTSAGWANDSVDGAPSAGLVGRGMPLDEWAVAEETLCFTPPTSASSKVMAEQLGYPVGIAANGVGATSLRYLSAPNGEEGVGGGWPVFLGTLSQTHGIPDFVVWHQGETNINGAPGTVDSTDFYARDFHNLLLPSLRQATGNPNLIVLIVPIGNNPDLDNSPNDPSAPARCRTHFPLLKLEYEKVVAGSGHQYSDPNVHYAASMVGIPHADVHYPSEGYAENERRWAWSALKHVYGLNVHDGRGPIVTGATKTSATTIELTLDLNGATALAGTGALTGYLASADNFATSIAGSWARSGNKIVFTASAALPSGTIKVDSFRDASYNDSNVATGTYADTTPIPVWPIMTPIVVS